MKIVYIGLYRVVSEKEAWRLACASHVVDFSYFTRSSVTSGCQFAARTSVQRTKPGCRQTIQLEEKLPFVAHTYVRGDGLAGVVMADKEYPVRVAFTLVTKEMGAYEEKVGSEWRRIEADQPDVEPEFLKEDIVHYQDPRKADKLTAIQTQLDEVKDVMHTNIEQLLHRGETLDSLMEKSDDLNQASVHFYKQARKANSCCGY